MKRLILLMSFLLFFNLASAQNELPNVMVKEMKGKTKHLSEFVAKEGLTIFVFWKSCCPISLGVLSSLKEALEESEESNHPLTFVLVSMDDSRSVNRVRPIVASYEWIGRVILDVNQEFARRMNIVTPPQWLVVNSKGREVFRCKITSSYTDVDLYLDQIRELKLE